MEADIMTTEELNLATVRRYLEAISVRAPVEEILAFYAEDVLQVEFPNRLVPNGARRDLAGLAEASRRGRVVIASESYEITSAIAAGDKVALEVIWTGVLTVDLGALKAGEAMRARFGVFFELRDGRIRAQRNYDCFDPF